ncbi:uncharacterized protein LOC129003565 [Macrosteles quadrilineatus]|uniref:uncharacterized protein LOC129003454 n=1 Tax=Macrosteles quadrilineatus TaxID=74068 RepID=UPI0023E2EF4F|nr:uncharacterized protein LOC129003454 [Macrosteles quadrilineatus]XP_054287836.1 uncharacterized protein LOC129003565 [Macrosteles quadrilineatus]
MSDFIAQLEQDFKLKVTGPETYLGMEIHRAEGRISLSQKSYIKSVLERYRMSECNPVGTPLCTKYEDTLEENKPLSKGVPFREAVGSLMYITNTRPDISSAVNIVAQKLNNPTMQAWSDVKRIFRYLKGTLDYSIDLK